jgi:SAM-dependent methyltransferase
VAQLTNPTNRYLNDEYREHNPTWDVEDSPWKATLAKGMLERVRISPRSICDVGCGAGFVLAELRRSYADAELYGFDIAPALPDFWKRHEGSAIQFELGDFVTSNSRHYDVVLCLDVIEHIPDPFAFLSAIRGSANHFVFIIPLDLSAMTVARERPLLRQRREVGHLHYFTKNLALSLLRECGYSIVEWSYSGAALRAPRKTWKTRLAVLPRLLAQVPNRDFGVRLLGGETLVVLASTDQV